MVLSEGDPVSYCLDAKKAIRELARVAKENSYVIVSVDNKNAKFPGVVSKLAEESSLNKILEYVSSGMTSFIGEFEFQSFTPKELRDVFETCGLKVVRIIGKPILSRFIPKERGNEIISKKFKQTLDLELKICDNPSLIEISSHFEIVGRKITDY